MSGSARAVATPHTHVQRTNRVTGRITLLAATLALFLPQVTQFDPRGALLVPANARWLLILLMAIWMIWYGRRDFEGAVRRLGVATVLLLLTVGVASLASSSPRVALTQWAVLLVSVLVGIGMATSLAPAQAAAAWVLCQILALGISVAVSWVWLGTSFWAWPGIYPYKNLFAFYGCIGLATSLVVLATLRKARWRILALVLGWLAVTAIANSASGTGMAVAAVTVACFALALISRLVPPATRVALFVVVAFGGIVVTLALVAAGRSPWTWALEGLGKNETLTGRSVIWARAIDVWQADPWLGLGPDVFHHDKLIALQNSSSAIYTDEQLNYTGAHSQYLQVLTDVGVLGAVVCLIWIVVSLHAAWALTRYADAWRQVLARMIWAAVLVALIFGITEMNVIYWSSPLVAMLTYVKALSPDSLGSRRE